MSQRCLDENKHEVIIPFSHRALLYDVAENYGPPTTPTTNNNNSNTLNGGGGKGGGGGGSGHSIPGVVNTNTIVEVGNKYLPRVFRHILGDPPSLTHAFTGLLRCYSVFTEETVMAATVSSAARMSCMSPASSCLELATDSSARFNIALNASELKRTYQYAVALKTCEEQAPSYVRAIKVSFTVQPVVTMLDDLLDPSPVYGDDGEEECGGIPDADTATAQGAMQTSAAASFAAVGLGGEDVKAGEMHLDTDSEMTDRRHDERMMIDDVNDDAREDDSVMTDDVDGSIMDTTSVSDATDINCGESFDGASVSDMVEVDANSEFDISWGELKRARSYSGSISTITNSGTRSSCSSSDSEDSVVEGQDNHDSSVSHDSTLTKDTNSSASGDTVVLRASSASPVYANVQKKSLSVFNAEQKDGLSGVTAEVKTEQTDGAIKITEGSGERGETCVGLHDSSVRSVWNITPTVEEAKRSSRGFGDSSRSDLTRAVPCGVEGEGDAQPICWGDGNEADSELLLDSNDSIMELHQTLRLESGESNTSTLERHPAKPSAQTSTASHPQLSSQSSVASVGSSHSTVVPHPLLSSRSSVQSEGGAQDLAIQRLERALDEASNFIKSSGPPPHAGPTPPPRRGRPKLADRNGSAETSSSPKKMSQRASRDSLHKAEPSHAAVPGGFHPRNVAPGTSSVTCHSLPATASVADQRTAEHFRENSGYNQATQGKAVHYQSDSRIDAGRPAAGGDATAVHYQSDSRIDAGRPAVRGEAAAVHRQSDSKIVADGPAQKEAAHRGQNDGQIDLDFVKTLENKLMAVSRKSSLPKYQRLQAFRDLPGDDGSGIQDGRSQFRKKQQKPGFFAGRPGGGSASSSSSRDTDGDGASGAKNSTSSEDQASKDSSQKEVILDEFDLLQEEAV